MTYCEMGLLPSYGASQESWMVRLVWPPMRTLVGASGGSNNNSSKIFKWHLKLYLREKCSRVIKTSPLLKKMKDKLSDLSLLCYKVLTPHGFYIDAEVVSVKQLLKLKR